MGKCQFTLWSPGTLKKGHFKLLTYQNSNQGIKWVYFVHCFLYGIICSLTMGDVSVL